jgi:transcriptional regulator with XRE-family HTH domain
MAPTMGAVLRQAREVRGLSSIEAARSADISSAYLSKLENDAVKRPSPRFCIGSAGSGLPCRISRLRRADSLLWRRAVR